MAAKTLAGKKIMCLFGGKDRLVPHAISAPFLDWLRRAIDPSNGWLRDQGIELEEVVDPEGRHEASAAMRAEAERWLCQYLHGSDHHADRQSKI